RKGGSKSVVMNTPGVVSVFCNLHPQMLGTIFVLPGPLWARTAADGTFRLDVPPGKHRLVAWSPEALPVTKEITVADAPLDLRFELDERAAPRARPRKDAIRATSSP